MPATVRAQFAKVLRLYSDGLFTYEHFTSASRGSWQDLHEAVRALGATWQADTVKAVDRIFYMRVCAGAIDYARSGAQVRALHASAPDERWFVVTADAPGDARNHVHRVVTGSCKPRHCHCPVTPIYEGARLETVVRHAKEHPAA